MMDDASLIVKMVESVHLKEEPHCVTMLCVQNVPAVPRLTWQLAVGQLLLIAEL